MGYTCPRCGEPVQRGYSSKAQIGAGLIGALFYAAFGSFVCKQCGKIKRSEFPPEIRRKMVLGSVAMVAGAILILAVVLWLVAQ